MGQSEHPAPRIEGYEYIRPIGRGGFSDVYLYQQKMPNREVAIKVLRTDALTDSLRSQFSAEANLMARLSNHTNIASIYAADIDEAGGEPYLVMEYCSGGSLGDSYRQYPMSVRDVLKLGVRLCGALEAAHRAGIVHRDIKPANILLTEYGVPVLTDFGISTIDEEFPEATMARAQVYTQDSSNSDGAVGLSLPWAAPETLGDPPVSDTRSDRYSLAATLYSLLEGRSPHEIPGGPNGASHLTGRIQSGFLGTMRRPDVPASLVDVLAKGMAFDRAARFSSSVALGKALQEVQRELGHDVTALDIPRRQEPAIAPPSDTRARPANRDDVISLPRGHSTVLPEPGGAAHGGAQAPRRRDLRPPSPWQDSDPSGVPPPPPTHTSGGGQPQASSMPPPPPTHTSGGGQTRASSVPPPQPQQPAGTTRSGAPAAQAAPPLPSQHAPPAQHSGPPPGHTATAPLPPQSAGQPVSASHLSRAPAPTGRRRRIIAISTAAALVVALLVGGLWWFNRAPSFDGPAVDHLQVHQTGGRIFQVDIPEGLEEPTTIETRVLAEGSEDPVEEHQQVEISLGHNSWLPGYPVDLDPRLYERNNDSILISTEDLDEALGEDFVGMPAGSVVLVAAPKGYFANRAPDLEIDYVHSQLAAIQVLDSW